MWRYGIGKEPEKKKPKTDEEKIIRDREYDKLKRIRSFLPNWLQLFDWLEYDQESNRMFCSLCKLSPLADKQSAFVVGSQNFKIDPIKAHSQSVNHTRVVTEKNISLEQPGSSQASKVLSSLKKSQTERLMKLFRTAHAIAKHSRPFTDFVWQCELDFKKNVDIGQTYHNDKACKEFIKCISQAALQQLIQDIHNALCFSIMCDESTDSGVLEELIIYVVYCSKGIVSTKFLCLTALNKPDAESIYSCLLDACRNTLKLSQPFSKLVCFLADGAATMQGKKTGVGQRLTEQQPNLIKLHCMAHRLELSFKGAVKSFDNYYKVEEFLLKLYLFYHNSPSNRAQLKEACESSNIKSLVPTRVGGTRWLPHINRACQNLWTIYEAVILQLENCSVSSKTESSSNAQAFLKLMTSKSFIWNALELSELVSCLQKVSLTLQSKDNTLFQAQHCISAVMESLEDLKQDARVIEEKLNAPPFQGKLKDTLGSRNRNKAPCEEGLYIKLLDKMIEQLTIRFPEVSPTLISASKLLSLKQWPSQISADFGKADIKALLQEYGKLLESLKINTSDIVIEWISLRTSIYSCHPDLSILTWIDINSQHHIGHSNILAFFDFLLTLPSTSTECERGFSSMKIIKNDWRNKLTPETLTCLMRVQLDTQEIKEFDPTRAVSLWLESGVKKIETKPYGKRKL